MADSPENSKRHATPPGSPDRSVRAGTGPRSTEGRFKLLGVPVGTTVAGAAILATLRAWNKRRIARKQQHNPATAVSQALEPGETQALAAAGDGDISLAPQAAELKDTAMTVPLSLIHI